MSAVDVGRAGGEAGVDAAGGDEPHQVAVGAAAAMTLAAAETASSKDSALVRGAAARRAARSSGPARAARPGGPAARRCGPSTASGPGAGRRRRRRAAARRSPRRCGRGAFGWLGAGLRVVAVRDGQRQDRVDAAGARSARYAGRRRGAPPARGRTGRSTTTSSGPTCDDAPALGGQPVGGDAVRSRRRAAARAGRRRGCRSRRRAGASTGERRGAAVAHPQLDPARRARVDPGGCTDAPDLERRARAGVTSTTRPATSTAATPPSDEQLEQAEHPAADEQHRRAERRRASPCRVSTAGRAAVAVPAGTGTAPQHVAQDVAGGDAPGAGPRG